MSLTQQTENRRATEVKHSMKATAQMIGVHVSTVSRMMSGGKIGYYQIGGRRVIGQSHLETYLAYAERQATKRL